MELARLGPPIFFLLQLVTAQIFRFFLPEQLTVGNGSQTGQQMYVSRRIAIWIGPIAALLVGMLASVLSASYVLLIDAAIYVAMIYLYLANLRGRHRS